MNYNHFFVDYLLFYILSLILDIYKVICVLLLLEDYYNYTKSILNHKKLIGNLLYYNYNY